MRPKAYVGVTGFRNEREVQKVAAQFMERGFLGPDSGHTVKNHMPMFGFLCSSNRLADKTKPGKESPRAEVLGCLTRYVPRGAFPTIHYFTRNREELADEVKQVFDIDGMYENNYCRGLQINMAWPDIEQVAKIRSDFPDMSIILQLPREAFSDMNRAEEYGDLVQYCLVDPSGGLGTQIANDQLGLVSLLHESLPNTRIGIAGGLEGGNVAEIMELVYRTVDDHFSVDAQGRLRTDNKRKLQMGRTRDYVNSAARGIRNGEKFYI